MTNNFKSTRSGLVIQEAYSEIHTTPKKKLCDSPESQKKSHLFMILLKSFGADLQGGRMLRMLLTPVLATAWTRVECKYQHRVNIAIYDTVRTIFVSGISRSV